MCIYICICVHIHYYVNVLGKPCRNIGPSSNAAWNRWHYSILPVLVISKARMHQPRLVGLYHSFPNREHQDHQNWDVLGDFPLVDPNVTEKIWADFPARSRHDWGPCRDVWLLMAGWSSHGSLLGAGVVSWPKKSIISTTYHHGCRWVLSCDDHPSSSQRDSDQRSPKRGAEFERIFRRPFQKATRPKNLRSRPDVMSSRPEPTIVHAPF